MKNHGVFAAALVSGALMLVACGCGKSGEGQFLEEGIGQEAVDASEEGEKQEGGTFPAEGKIDKQIGEPGEQRTALSC